MYLLIPVAPFSSYIITYAGALGEELLPDFAISIVTTGEHCNEKNHEKSKVVLRGLGLLFLIEHILLVL